MTMLFQWKSTLRPVTQLPLQKLGWVFAPEFVGPEVREFLTNRELTAFEVSQLSLEFVGTREE